MLMRGVRQWHRRNTMLQQRMASVVSPTRNNSSKAQQRKSDSPLDRLRDGVVEIVEVGPRDGLQNESTIVSVDDRVEFIRLLAQAGCNRIEAGSFVSEQYVPSMAQTDQVMEKLWTEVKGKRPEVQLSCLVPTLAYIEQAIDADVDEIAIFASASEGFSKKNINCTIDESLERFQAVVQEAQRYHIPVRGYLSCIFSCPYDGATDPKQVGKVTEQLLELGCHEVSLGDTVGTGTPERTKTVVDVATQAAGGDANVLAVHFHDTYGRAMDNILVALEMDIKTIDSSVSGLGGCPYAKGATGNVATEEVVLLLESLGIETGIDVEKLMVAGDFINGVLGRESKGRVARRQKP